ncbi:MAG: serpin family protein [Blastocatellia bacterium]
MAKQMDISPEFIRANNSFSLEVFKAVYSSNKNKNIFISPFSLALNLSILLNGAKENTYQEIVQALDLESFSLPQINANYQKLANLLTLSDSKLLLQISNSLWANNNLSFCPTFLNQVKDYYKAEINNLDFSNSSSVNYINDWVKKVSLGKIPEIIKDIEAETILIILNAIYFKGIWTRQFNRQNTEEKPFYLSEQSIKLCPMMISEDLENCLVKSDFSAIDLPYGDGRFSFSVFLPKENLSLESFCQSLSQENWHNWFSDEWSKGKVIIPRFRLTFNTDLKSFLSQLGISSLFSNANLGFLANTNLALKVNKFIQNTFLDVNEEGTEAIAVTMSLTMAAGMPLVLEFNRPFFYTIKDNLTGLILFMGTLVNPQGKDLSVAEIEEILQDDKLKKEMSLYQYYIYKENKKTLNTQQKHQQINSTIIDKQTNNLHKKQDITLDIKQKQVSSYKSFQNLLKANKLNNRIHKSLQKSREKQLKKQLSQKEYQKLKAQNQQNLFNQNLSTKSKKFKILSIKIKKHLSSNSYPVTNPKGTVLSDLVTISKKNNNFKILIVALLVLILISILIFLVFY